MPNVSREQLNEILAWSDPVELVNSRGRRLVSYATPTKQFWGLWRASKAEIRALDYAVDYKDGVYTVLRYQDPPTAAPTAPVPVVLDTPVVAPVAAPTPRIAAPVTSAVVTPAPAGRRWSDEQEAIFSWFRTPNGRNLVVRARAGTGKTTTIKAAFAVSPEDSMLYAVFNKKNQVEAAEAIDDPRVEIRTLHSLGLRFINAVWANSRPSDTVEDARIVRVIGENAPLEVKATIRKLVAFAKNTFINPSVDDLFTLAGERDLECPGYEAPQNGGWTQLKLAEAAHRALELATVRDEQGRISYNDMVWLPVRMQWVRSVFELVVVDEAQDMNVPQLEMAIRACKPDGRICVVGDDRQAIYGFRGAASDGISMMVDRLNAIELGLTVTYRCPKAVVARAALLVPDYKAADSAPEGTVEILSSLDSVQVGDAILSRSNAPLMPVCLSLLRRGIRARIEGKDIGKQLLEIVRKLRATTVPQFLTKLEAYRSRMSVRYAAGAKNVESKLEELDDTCATLRAIAEGASGVGEIETRLNVLFSNSEDDRGPKVTLSSVHKAKGLEWNKVYLISKTFNRKRSVTAAPISEEAERARAKEEANIYYVALTRAKAHLVLVVDDTERSRL